MSAAPAVPASVGVVGIGRWGRHWVRVLSEIGALAWAADMDPRVRRAFANDQQGVYPTFPFPTEGTLVHGTDAVVVATPPHTHREVVERLLSLGARTILVEKPMAPSAADARAMAAAAADRGANLVVGHTFLHSEVVARAVRLVDERLGGVEAIRMRWTQPTGGHPDVLLNLMPHPLSLVLPLTTSRRPRRVRAWGAVQGERRDWVRTVMEMEDGPVVDILVAHAHPEKVRELEVVGSGGTVLCRPTQGETVWFDPATGESEISHRPGVEPLRNLAERLVEVAAGADVPVRHVRGADGVWVAAVMDHVDAVCTYVDAAPVGAR